LEDPAGTIKNKKALLIAQQGFEKYGLKLI
jgi:hypothetical protein